MRSGIVKTDGEKACGWDNYIEVQAFPPTESDAARQKNAFSKP